MFQFKYEYEYDQFIESRFFREGIFDISFGVKTVTTTKPLRFNLIRWI